MAFLWGQIFIMSDILALISLLSTHERRDSPIFANCSAKFYCNPSPSFVRLCSKIHPWSRKSSIEFEPFLVPRTRGPQLSRLPIFIFRTLPLLICFHLASRVFARSYWPVFTTSSFFEDRPVARFAMRALFMTNADAEISDSSPDHFAKLRLEPMTNHDKSF